jgi:hypothetical protein
MTVERKYSLQFLSHEKMNPKSIREIIKYE